MELKVQRLTQNLKKMTTKTKINQVMALSQVKSHLVPKKRCVLEVEKLSKRFKYIIILVGICQVSEYNNKKKYASEVKSTDWRDMFYTDLDEGEDDGTESDTYHQELEEVRKRLTGDVYGSCNSDSPSGDEEDRTDDKKPR